MVRRAVLLLAISCGGSAPQIVSVSPAQSSAAVPVTAPPAVTARLLPQPKPPALALPVAFELSSTPPAREVPGRFPLWDALTPALASTATNATWATVVPPDFTVELAPNMGLRSMASFSPHAGAGGIALGFRDRVPSITTFGGRPCTPKPANLYNCGVEDEVQVVEVALDAPSAHRTTGRIVARVDRTPRCPMDASAASRAFLERGVQSALTGPLAAKLASMMQSAKEREPLATGGADSSDLRTFFAANVEDGRLALVFYARRIDQRTRDEVRTVPGSFGCTAPPGADCAPHEQPPQQVTMRVGRQWFAEIALEQRVGCDGTTAAEQERVSPLAPPSANVTKVVDRSDPADAASAPPLVTGCPQQPPTSGACMPAGLCSYAQTICRCMYPCRGGARVQPSNGPGPQPTWTCGPKPPAVRADGCPGMPPTPGAACATTLRCSYGRAESGACWGFTVACDQHSWIAVPIPPPP